MSEFYNGSERARIHVDLVHWVDPAAVRPHYGVLTECGLPANFWYGISATFERETVSCAVCWELAHPFAPTPPPRRRRDRLLRWVRGVR